MSIEFKLPELGENITSADIVAVKISVGDLVEKDQIVFEAETDKATIEIPSEVEGKVVSLNVKEGDKVNVGDILFSVEAASDQEAGKATVEEKAAPVVEESSKEVAAEEPVKEASVVTSGKREVKLPELGENIAGADVTKVFVKVGDTVSEGDTVLELETEKASMELPADFSGKIVEVLVKEGTKANVGDVIFVIESSGGLSPEPVKVVEKKVKEEPKQEEHKPRHVERTKKSVPSISRKQLGGILAPAAPSVRRFAREIGIKIENVKGSGPGGRISVDDVKKYAKSINEGIQSGTTGSGIPGLKLEKLPDFSKWGEIKTEKMSNVRRKTAEHLSYAWATVPHVTQFDKADITELEKLRKQYGKLAESYGGKLTVTAILLKVVAAALKKFPQFNASIDMQNEEIIYKNYYNIGIAVDTDRGLIVPVIRDVDKKNIFQLAKELTDISVKAREKKVTLEDMQGGNFTISNLGGIGGTSFTPIVNTPEVAILGVSRGSYEPVYKDGEFVPRLMLPLSLSYDHRIIDGADGARFVRWIAQALEQPLLLALEG